MQVGERGVEQDGRATAHPPLCKLLKRLVQWGTRIGVVALCMLRQEEELLAAAWVALVPVPPIIVSLCLSLARWARAARMASDRMCTIFCACLQHI